MNNNNNLSQEEEEDIELINEKQRMETIVDRFGNGIITLYTSGEERIRAWTNGSVDPHFHFQSQQLQLQIQLQQQIHIDSVVLEEISKRVKDSCKIIESLPDFIKYNNNEMETTINKNQIMNSDNIKNENDNNIENHSNQQEKVELLELVVNEEEEEIEIVKRDRKSTRLNSSH